MESTTDLPASSPLDVSTWARIVAFIGVPSFLAIGLTYWLTTMLSTQLDAQGKGITANGAAIATHAATEEADHRITRALLYAICRGVNKSDEARELCEVGR